MIINDYQVISELGKGGFATTHLATNQAGEQFAIKKFILDKYNFSLISSVEKEVKILKQISHPKIPKFIDFFRIDNSDNIELYIVQEYINASNLRKIIKEGKHYNESEAIDITIQILKILEYLHNFLPQIIHRDVKPSNILIDKDNIVYLIDFGAVKEKLTYGNISQSGISTIIGTQGYMSIEQFEGKAIPSSDIYSLGLTLLYILSHKEPLQLKKNGLDFLFRDLINVSDKFELIISKMINPDYTKRYMSIFNLKRELYALNNQKIKMNVKDNKSMNRSVQEHLSEGEKVIWLERPILKKVIFKPYLMLNVIFGSLLSFFSFIFALILVLITITTHFISLPITAVLGFIVLQIMLVGIGLITSPYYTIKKSLNTVYAVTNKRILLIPPIDNNQKINIFFRIPLGIIRAIGKGYPMSNNFKSLPMFAIRFMENNFNSTELREILEYLNHVVEINQNDLKKIVIERSEYKDGSGDLIFYRGEDEKKNPVLKIIAVNNPKKLEQIIINTFKKE